VRRLEEKKDTGSKQGGELAGWLALAVQFRHRSLSCAACALQLFSVMAMFMQKLFGAAEPTWMDHGYREEEQEEPYYAETISYRIYPEPPSSFTRYPEHPLAFAHLFEPPPPPLFNNYPAALLPYGGHLFLEPPTKLVRFSDPGLEQQPARRPQVIRRSSQPKKVHPEIELRVPMCCRKCEDKVEIELKKMEGKVHTSWSVYSWL
jgi:hypothetical protein